AAWHDALRVLDVLPARPCEKGEVEAAYDGVTLRQMVKDAVPRMNFARRAFHVRRRVVAEIHHRGSDRLAPFGARRGLQLRSELLAELVAEARQYRQQLRLAHRPADLANQARRELDISARKELAAGLGPNEAARSAASGRAE